MLYTLDDPAHQTPEDRQAQESLMALAARRRRDGLDDGNDDTDKKPARSLTGTFNTKAQEAAAAVAKVSGSDMPPEQMQQQLALLDLKDMRSDTDGVTITTATNGNIHVRKNCVSIDYDSAVSPDHPRNITAIMESAVVVKTAFNDKIVFIGTDDPHKKMLQTYAAELAGITIGNPSETKLQDAHPELAARMKEEWDTMQAKAGLEPGAGIPTPEISADTDVAAIVNKVAQPVNNMGARV